MKKPSRLKVMLVLVLFVVSIFSVHGTAWAVTLKLKNEIVGNNLGDNFSKSVVFGDFDNDGDDDMAVGASGYNSDAGRVYIYLNDGDYASVADSADVIIGGETGSGFGWSLTSGDFDNDGDDDLAVSAADYASNQGRAYVFYQDGSWPSDAANADEIITGEATGNNFGRVLRAGDVNQDNKTDLLVSANNYDSGRGRVYVFHNDGSYTTGAANADLIITGETANGKFGGSLLTGDLSGDGEDEIIASAMEYNYNTGRVYIFANDGSYPTSANNADNIITGSSSTYFGFGLTVGDFDGDSDLDLATGGIFYGAIQGAAYIFYQDGSWPTTAGSADHMITGETDFNWFAGGCMTSIDLDNDNDDDLVIGALGANNHAGRAYVFENDGAYPTSAANADHTFDGEHTMDRFAGYWCAAGDANGDGYEDLAIADEDYTANSDIGKLYVYYQLPPADVDSTADVGTGSTIGDGSVIEEDVTIKDDVEIGEECTIGADTTIKEGSTIGDETEIGESVEIKSDVTVGGGVTIGDDTTIKSGSTVGDNTTIGANSEIKDYVDVGANVTIGTNTTIKSGVTIGDGTTIGNNTEIKDDVTIGENCQIGNNVTIKANVVVADNTVIADGTIVSN
ncbi:FG-GAP repeat protein [Patescibacteria group bacterium]|nr:FG-GAP repeat protein [Patescibacteria group bacterium]